MARFSNLYIINTICPWDFQIEIYPEYGLLFQKSNQSIKFFFTGTVNVNFNRTVLYFQREEKTMHKSFGLFQNILLQESCDNFVSLHSDFNRAIKCREFGSKKYFIDGKRGVCPFFLFECF